MPVWWQVLTAAIGLVVGGAAAFVAWHQAQTNRIRLQHELFERRYAIFKAVHAYLSYIMREGGLPERQERGEKMGAFLDAMQRSRFLFKDEITSYLNQIYKRSIGTMIFDGKIAKPDKKSEDLLWLSEQIAEIFDVFAKHMKLDIVALPRVRYRSWREIIGTK